MGIDASDAYPLGTMDKEITKLTEKELHGELTECVENMSRWFPINTPGKLDAMRASLRYIEQDLREIERRLGRQAMCRLGWFITEERHGEFGEEAKNEGKRHSREREKQLLEDFLRKEAPPAS